MFSYTLRFVKPEKCGQLHLVYHFTMPLKTLPEEGQITYSSVEKKDFDALPTNCLSVFVDFMGFALGA